MFSTVYESTVSYFDIEKVLKSKRKKKLQMGFISLMMGRASAFYIL